MFGSFGDAEKILVDLQDRYLKKMADAGDEPEFIAECLSKIHVLGLAIHQLREARKDKIAEFEEHEACRFQGSFEAWQQSSDKDDLPY